MARLSTCSRYAKRKQKLKEYIRGWVGYYHLANTKRLLHETDEWLRHRIRMCIWKAWKLPKTRMKNLVRCGINKYDARRWGYVKGYWRVSSSPIMHLAASSQKLHQAGYPTLMGSYLEWQLFVFYFPKVCFFSRFRDFDDKILYLCGVYLTRVNLTAVTL